MNISAEKIVIAFFIIAVVVSVSGLVGMGITFIIRMRQNEISAEKEDEEYRVFLQRGYTLRFCYGYSVFADVVLQFIEVIATALGTFIVLLESVESYLVVILLVTSFAASVLRNGLNLKNNRIAYAKAFRVLEFALDEYRLSDKKKEDKEKLCEANREAQKVIEIYNE